MKLLIVAALANNNVIGRQNALPWRLSADLKHFKKITMGQSIVMGRKTWDSIGRALPGRTNIVLSRQGCVLPEGVVSCRSLSEAKRYEVGKGKDCMIIGGGELYKRALSEGVDEMHLTHVLADVVGDTYFPHWNPSDWELLSRKEVSRDENNEFDMAFCHYRRNR